MNKQPEQLQPPGQSPRRLIVAGLIITVVSGFLTLVFLLATVLAANPCGAFGDTCDDQGSTSMEFVVVLVLTLLTGVAFITGVVLVITGVRRRSAQRRGPMQVTSADLQF